MIQSIAVSPERLVERRIEESFVDRMIADGTWREEVIPAKTIGLSRDITVFRAQRKGNFIAYDWHGDKDTFCPPIWWDLAIGSGACGLGCRACFLMLTFRAMRDPLRHVLYENVNDLWDAADAWLSHPKRRPFHTLGIGIDRSDSLLYEGVTGHARTLIPMFANKNANPQNCKLILLTKSTNVHYLKGLPIENVIVSFSLNPEPIADLWEGKYPDTLERITPSIIKRLHACLAAQEMGFEIRWRIDPILTPENWVILYKNFFEEAANLGLKPRYITFGTYREKNKMLDLWREKWGLPEMEWQPNGLAQDGTHRHLPDAERIKTYKEVVALSRQYFPLSKISLCKETHAVRKALGLCNADCNCLM
ncbi:hypothetical protein L0337_01700 [candidate division KSB1 bacterium]|nr:hypothetical protein [candidate division KSB1 bacterium]